PPASDQAWDEALQLAILAGYPDRVGRRRSPRSAEVVFAAGGSGTLSPSSVVVEGDLLVAVDASDTGDRGRARVTIRRASRIDATWLIELFEDRVRDVDELRWNRERHRVERVTRLVYDDLTIDESVDIEGARRDPAAAAVLVREALAAGIERFVDPDALAAWRARIGFVAASAPALGLQVPDDAALAAVLADACAGLTSFDELKKASLLDLLDASVAAHRGAIDRLAPRHVQLAGRRRAQVHYELDRPPWVASRLQDFLGLARGPAVADGRVPLVLHLLAPNQRPVQVTQDLAGFWVRHYPALRKELSRRYPRHAWPEDPTALMPE
ncbi:MAG: ATP-dependent helicase HrpB, partial [Myxococcales bacterium]|nr:ATP-dependent helicase HrpB [Myxococcales bacterium]